LRVLAIVALDTLHVLRTSRPLSRKRVGELAMVIDFQACTNAAWDRKTLSPEAYRASRERLETAGLGMHLDEYLDRLRALESRRPPIGGDQRNFDDVRAYREEVVRISLATLTAIALDGTQDDGDLDALFRMAMQCQIIDDVLDYREDLRAGLPSFLTATGSRSKALELTARAARSYGRGQGVLPLRVALRILSMLAQLVMRWGVRPITATVPGKPARAGIDPRYLLCHDGRPSGPE